MEARLADHNNSMSTYTKRGEPRVLKWSEEFPTRSYAVAEELRIKKKSRKYIEYLIGSAGQSIPNQILEDHRFSEVNSEQAEPATFVWTVS